MPVISACNWMISVVGSCVLSQLCGGGILPLATKWLIEVKKKCPCQVHHSSGGPHSLSTQWKCY